MADPASTAIPGATYKFLVRTAEEAVQTIRERLGPNARVLSVRQVGAGGLGGLLGQQKLEVIAQVSEKEADVGKIDLAAGGQRTEPANFAGSSLLTEGFNPEMQADGRSVALLPNGTRRAQRRDTLPRLPELLRRSGFSEAVIGRVQTSLSLTDDDDRPLHHALVEVGQHFRSQAGKRRPRPLPARTAFLGTPGVGRTTALCKWLAREVFELQRQGRVLKAEFDRPNPAEGLAVFCEALGLSLEYYAPADEQAPSTIGGPPGEFLYADLPGLSLRNPKENETISRFLEREKFTGRVLVLNGLYDISMLRRSCAAGVDLGATHVVFTHLDELEHWGRLWDFLLESELTPLFLATGPSLTGDCDADPVNAVLRKTLPGA